MYTVANQKDQRKSLFVGFISALATHYLYLFIVGKGVFYFTIFIVTFIRVIWCDLLNN